MICFDKYLSSFHLTCTTLLSHCLYKRNFKGYLEILAKYLVSASDTSIFFVVLDPFITTVRILYPLKRPKSLRFSDVFRGYKIGIFASNGLITHHEYLFATITRFSTNSRSSHPKVFLGKGNLKICSKFTGEHPCQSIISIKLFCNFIEITLRHGCCPVNLLYILRTPFLKNPCGRLFLEFLFI